MRRASAEALGEREGAVLVIDPRSGRLRAAINPRLAFEQAFPPGSAIKPFTALAALRSGSVNVEARVACRRNYSRGDFSIACTHPPNHDFNLSDALAHSCNYYFATLVENLGGAAWAATLHAFGFGERTGVNAGGEAAGRLADSAEWRTPTALGEGDGLLTTPVQLLSATTALINGGRLFRPQLGDARNFVARERARVRITAPARKTILRGMRESVTEGTAAEHADWKNLPLYVFGKTGTSTDSNNFRTQGWFVGFAAAPEAASSADVVPAEDAIALGLVVFVRRAHGAESAAIAHRILQAYAALKEEAAPSSGDAAPPSLGGRTVRVLRVSERKVEEVPLEDYLIGVLDAEAGAEDEGEALKAQAIVSRTFALKNMRRHSSEGYDFCSTTHCQRYKTSAAKPSTANRRAVAETINSTVKDNQGQTIDAYFHAACGGRTANIKSLWGATYAADAAPTHLSGVEDDFCATMPHRDWGATIAAADLARALRVDARSDVGEKINDVSIIKRDSTRRAETVLLGGTTRRRTISGWDFKIIVGRALGWNLLKSSLFEVSKRGDAFVFRGHGFGHGLGLCQEGAHVMARRDRTAAQIIAHYYPGTTIDDERDEAEGGSLNQNVSYFIPHPSSLILPPQRRTLSDEHFRLSFGARTTGREAEKIFRTLGAARTSVDRRLRAASLDAWRLPRFDVVLYDTTAEFVDATGQPGWIGGVTRGRKIELQPPDVLARRGALVPTLRHEYAHAVIEAIGRGRAPRWIAEGLAAHLAGEGPQLLRQRPGTKEKLSVEELEKKLAEKSSSPRETSALYAAAYSAVIAFIDREGEAKLWRTIAGE